MEFWQGIDGQKRLHEIFVMAVFLCRLLSQMYRDAAVALGLEGESKMRRIFRRRGISPTADANIVKPNYQVAAAGNKTASTYLLKALGGGTLFFLYDEV